MNSKIIVSMSTQGVATISLNRPEKHNALDDQLILELSTALQRVENDASVRVVVLAAVGKTFSAGGDLAWMKRTVNYSQTENLTDARALAKVFRTLNTLTKPTIARVQGAAFGGAVGLISCCDIAIGTDHSKFCLSEVKIGLIPATISPYVVAAIGERAARRYFLSAEAFDSAQANRLGLLHEVVTPDSLDSRVTDIIEGLLANGPKAIAAAKQLIFEVVNKDITDDLVDQTSQRIAAIRVSPEGQEGLTAFLQKRPPAWHFTDAESEE